MKIKNYFFFLLFVAIALNAQTYSWQWAKNGGGDNGTWGNFPSLITDEMITDVVTDNQNNSYYLTSIFIGNTILNGNAVGTYGFRNLLLFSTDCTGNIRWSRVIGGGGDLFFSRKIVVDNNGGIYLTIYGLNQSGQGSNQGWLPLRFDDNNVMPAIVQPSNSTNTDPGLNTGFLLKYNAATGALISKKNLQDDVRWDNRTMDVGVIYRDSNGTLHAILGYLQGTHLNGAITVPSSYNYQSGVGYPNGFQYYIVKFDSNLNVVGVPILLPIAGRLQTTFGGTRFLYDELLNRYYIGGNRSVNFLDYYPLSYNNIPITEDGFLLAINGNNGTELWRKEINNPSSAPDDKIYSIIKDSSSNLFLSGCYVYETSAGSVSFGNFTFPTNISSYGTFVMKLDSNGNVLWNRTPDGYSNGSPNNLGIGSQTLFAPITLNGNEVAFAKGATRDIWGSFSMTRPNGDYNDPLIVRLNKDTGLPIATHEIKSSFGFNDQFTAITSDNDGNYLLGGFFHNQLFTDPNDNIPTMTYVGSDMSQFFITKLANTACSNMATVETPVKQTDVVLYPNPVEDVLHIKTKEKLVSYEVITADGRLVKQDKFQRPIYTVNMQELTKGVYYVKLQGEGFATAGKVVKK